MSFPFLNSSVNTGNAFKVYAQLGDAQEFMESCNSDTEKRRIFSYQGFRNGRSFFVYVVCTARNFWKAYNECIRRAPQHWYEQIPGDTLCRLYFDVEFYYRYNRHLDGETLLFKFVENVCEHIRSVFKIDVSYEDVVDLESSTDLKFSRHLIFHLPQQRLFVDTKNMGRFVKSLCDQMKGKIALLDAQTLQQYLDGAENCGFISNSEMNLSPMCDQGVYTRNRNFRLFLSSKFDKPTKLRLADSCQFFSSKGWNHPSEKEIFVSSLICPLLVSPHSGQSLSFDTNVYSNAYVDDDDEKKETSKKSFRPEIDAFVLKLAAADVQETVTQPVAPKIRSWRSTTFRTPEGTYDVIIYEMTGSRYCRNIGREHHHNNVYYVANLDEMMCYQQCHDYECRGYRSNSFPIKFDDEHQ